jgi:hypothetical protein
LKLEDFIKTGPRFISFLGWTSGLEENKEDWERPVGLDSEGKSESESELDEDGVGLDLSSSTEA